MKRNPVLLSLLFTLLIHNAVSSHVNSAVEKNCKSLNEFENGQRKFSISIKDCFYFSTNPKIGEELVQFRFRLFSNDKLSAFWTRKNKISPDFPLEFKSEGLSKGENRVDTNQGFDMKIPSTRDGELPNKNIKKGEIWVFQIQNLNRFFSAKIEIITNVVRRERSEEEIQALVDIVEYDETNQGGGWGRFFVELITIVLGGVGITLYHQINAKNFSQRLQELTTKEWDVDAKLSLLEVKEREMDSQQRHLDRLQSEVNEQRAKKRSEPNSTLNSTEFQKKIGEKSKEISKLEFQINTLKNQVKSLKDQNQNLLQSAVPSPSNLLRSLLSGSPKNSPRNSAAMGTIAPQGKKIAVDTTNVRVSEKLVDAVGGSFAGIYSCYVDGWNCCMKELIITEEMLFHFPTVKEKFASEIQLLESLPYHPNISRYLFHKEMDDRVQLFSTRYSSSLYTQIQQRRFNLQRLEELQKQRKSDPRKSIKRLYTFFPPQEIARLSLQLLDGLEFLHNHNIIHRDLKSDNIFVSLNETKAISDLAIGDFDTAKKLSESIQAKTAIGTPGYIAPEVWNAEEYTYKCDIFSFGMVLYEMVALLRPFEGSKGNPQFHINDRKIPEMDLQAVLDSYNWAQQLDSEGLAPPKDSEVENHQKYLEFGFAVIITLFRHCVQFKKSKRPELSEIREKLQTVLKGM